RFLAEAGALGDKLGPLLVQLPPSLAFDAATVKAFFSSLRTQFRGGVVCEPRHPSWFTPAAEALLAGNRVARAAADPAGVPAAPGREVRRRWRARALRSEAAPGWRFRTARARTPHRGRT